MSTSGDPVACPTKWSAWSLVDEKVWKTRAAYFRFCVSFPPSSSHHMTAWGLKKQPAPSHAEKLPSVYAAEIPRKREPVNEKPASLVKTWPVATCVVGALSTGGHVLGAGMLNRSWEPSAPSSVLSQGARLILRSPSPRERGRPCSWCLMLSVWTQCLCPEVPDHCCLLKFAFSRETSQRRLAAAHSASVRGLQVLMGPEDYKLPRCHSVVKLSPRVPGFGGRDQGQGVHFAAFTRCWWNCFRHLFRVISVV